MRYLGRVDAPLERVRELFRDVDGWASWMPDITFSRVLESGPDWRRAEVCQMGFGRRFPHVLEVRFDGDRIPVRTIGGGWFQWRGVWSFQKPPAGGGTTVSLELELDMRLFGRASSRMFHKMNERRVVGTVLAATQLLRRTAAHGAEEGAPGRTILAVYETADGYEVHYGGRRYVSRRKPLT